MTTFSVNTPFPTETNPQRGIASLTWGNHTLRFRTNPNEVSWGYSLITKTDQTYGGRVVQILGTRIEDLTVKIECGMGGWPYLIKVVAFLRDLMVAQRSGERAVFEYTTRGWKLKVYIANFPFSDSVSATTRELTLNFKVQEDITGIVSSQSIINSLQAFSNGVGWQRDQYNSMPFAPNNNTGMIPNAETFAGAALNLPAIGNGGNYSIPGAIQSVVSTVTGGASTAANGGTQQLANLFTVPSM